LFVGGRTRADLDRRTNDLKKSAGSCETIRNELCITIPKRVAVNPMVVVHVNGVETVLNWGATVAAAIRSAGERNPNSILPALAIQKPYRERLAPVEFSPANRAILNMVLMGGESISWK
jgi:hypothetical protein